MRSAVVILAVALGQPCYAQTTDAEPVQPIERPTTGAADGWTLTLGFAPVLGPAWQGSRDMAFSIYPDLRIHYRDSIFASVPDGVGWNALNRDGWKAGPIAKIRFGRDEADGGSPFLIAGGSDALRGLGDIGATAEVGGFVEKRFGSERQWRVRGEIRRGFGGHEGVVADGSLTYQLRSGRAVLNVGPRATVASGAYMGTFFGIDAGQSQRSGLAPYEADGGILSYGIGGTLIRPLDRRSAVTLFTGVDRLGDEAGHSPLVRERGQRTQFSLGIGYGYRFNF